jgi:hypothetical protein
MYNAYMNYKPRVATGLFAVLHAAGVVQAHLESKLDAVDLSLACYRSTRSSDSNCKGRSGAPERCSSALPVLRFRSADVAVLRRRKP